MGCRPGRSIVLDGGSRGRSQGYVGVLPCAGGALYGGVVVGSAVGAVRCARTGAGLWCSVYVGSVMAGGSAAAVVLLRLGCGATAVG